MEEKLNNWRETFTQSYNCEWLIQTNVQCKMWTNRDRFEIVLYDCNEAFWKFVRYTLFFSTFVLFKCCFSNVLQWFAHYLSISFSHSLILFFRMDCASITNCSKISRTHMLYISSTFNWCWRRNRNVHYSCLGSIQRSWYGSVHVCIFFNVQTWLIFHRVSVCTLYRLFTHSLISFRRLFCFFCPFFFCSTVSWFIDLKLILHT